MLTRWVATTGLLLAVGVGGVAVAGPAAASPTGAGSVVTVNATVFAPGDPVTLSVTDFTPGALTLQIFSPPVVIGRGAAGADGSGSVTGIIPADYTGAHTVQVVGAGGELFSVDVTVTAGDGAVTPATSGTTLASTGAALTGIGVLGGVLVVGGVFFVVVGRRRDDDDVASV